MSRREQEIVDLVAQGLKNKAIAQRLGIAERTVKNHLQSIFHKVGVANRLELARNAIHRGRLAELKLPNASYPPGESAEFPGHTRTRRLPSGPTIGTQTIFWPPVSPLF